MEFNKLDSPNLLDLVKFEEKFNWNSWISVSKIISKYLDVKSKD